MSRADNPLSDPPAQILATDLDGTFIPLNNDPQNIADLQLLTTEFQNRNVSVVFVTGRHFASVMQAIGEFELPVPQWIICDVGTSIFQRQPSGEFTPVIAYQDYQDQIIASMPVEVLREQLQSISGLRLQEAEKQGQFKLSFYTDASQLEAQVDQVQHILDQTNAPYSIIHSVDPFNGDGLIDLLPATVSKALALEWWHQENQLDPASTVFSGDSGNDLAALTAGYRTILVGNAARSLAQRVYTLHRQSGWEDRLYLASGTATSAVLEGCRWFGLAAPQPTDITLPGATPVTSRETHFRVWAPHCKQVHVEINTDSTSISHELVRDHQGYHSATIPQASANACYQYRLDGDTTRPDPASRYQPQGVHSVSQIIDPRDFPWTDQNWQGIEKRDLVIYELHVGTFTQSGTFRAAIERLPELIELGITAVEIMPVAQSPGRWNWGYDGVDLFAVRNTYGTPDDFRAFVDECHRSGLAVILDVVYNHLGPEGNYLSEFGPYFSDRHHTPWGDAFNYDGPESEHVRQFIVGNAVYWLEDFHLDGLRLDAVHCMYDDSQPNILDDIRQGVSQYAETVRWPIHLFAETNVYNHELLTTDEHRVPYDGIWCDCLMYSIYSHVLPDLSLTHRQYHGTTDLVESLAHGYVFAGKDSQRTTDREQASQHLESLVIALQTHDSVGNHPHGKRIHHLTSKPLQKAAAGLVLLHPGIPLIFMGEEFATSAPFPFFVDFEDRHLRDAVDIGRRGDYPPHIWQDALLPSQAEAFFKAKWNEAPQRDPDMFQWYQSLLQFRKHGLRDGWLSAANLETAFDRDHNIFTLKYDRAEQGAILIHARLTPHALRDATSVSIPLEGAVLLSSVQDPEIQGQQIRLSRNQLILIHCDHKLNR